MFMRVEFFGGPISGQYGASEALDHVKVFFDERGKLVNLYVHQGDGVYLWSPVASKALSDKYDESAAKLRGPKSVFFPQTADPGDDEPSPAPTPEEESWKPSEPDQFLPATEWEPESAEPEDEPSEPFDGPP